MGIRRYIEISIKRAVGILGVRKSVFQSGSIVGLFAIIGPGRSGGGGRRAPVVIYGSGRLIAK